MQISRKNINNIGSDLDIAPTYIYYHFFYSQHCKNQIFITIFVKFRIRDFYRLNMNSIGYDLYITSIYINHILATFS